MKILLVTFEFPPQKGGMENYYYNLIKHLSGVDFVVLTLPQKDAKEFDQKQNFKIIRKNLLAKLIWPRWLKMFWQVMRLVKKEKLDLIWVGDVLPVGPAVYLNKYFNNIPYFVSTHGLDIMLPQKSIRKEKLMLKVLNNADFITANSQFTKHELANLNLAEEKIILVYPCPNILPTSFNISSEQINKARAELKLENKKVLLTVGRLTKRKGQDMVIKALPALLEKFPDLVYLIIGEGQEKESLKSQVTSLKLDDKVIILDNISDQELPIYYQLANIFIMPARDIQGDVEGFGIVYLEANSFGLPVVAGKSGGATEAVIDGQTGLLVNPVDEDDIYQKIFKLLSNPELYQKLSENGKLRVEKEFSWEKQIDKIRYKIQETSNKQFSKSQLPNGLD